MTSRRTRIFGMSLCLLVFGATVTLAAEKAEPKKGSTEAVLGHHLGSFVQAVSEDKAAGIAGLISDFTEESVVLTPEGAVHGLEAIRAFFTGLVEANPTFMEGFELIRQEIHGEVAYIVWKNDKIALGTDTFIVKNGKIMTQTFAAHVAASAVPKDDGHGH